DDAGFARIDRAHVLTGRQHRDDHVGAPAGRSNRFGACAIGCRKLIERRSDDIVAGDAMARLDEVERHGQTHIAEPDEPDLRQALLPLVAWTCGACWRAAMTASTK